MSKRSNAIGRDDPAEPGDDAGFIRPETKRSPALTALAPEDATLAVSSGSDNTTQLGGSRHAIRREGRAALSGRVLVLNASFEPINVCTVRRAVVLILKRKAEVIDEHELQVRAESISLTRPSVIRLHTFVHIPYQSFRRKITRRAVFARDDWSCQYCGKRGSLTVDHVVPRSKGGDTTWENVVACCAGCNRRKGNRSVSQAGMKLRTRPRAPHATIFIHVASPKIPTQWLPYVPPTAAAA